MPRQGGEGMNIDFHYGLIYVVSRLAGMSPQEAGTIAHACQYVDDATTPGVLLFAEGQTYERFVSAHSMLDYKNCEDARDRMVWAPFHFLPGNEGQTFEDRVVCRPDSAVAREMVKRFLGAKRKDNDLHHLGILLHTYVDTFAHYGFSGTISDINCVAHLDGHDHDRATWLEKLKANLEVAIDEVQSAAVQLAVKVGHGAALHFPDLPWAKWTYVNGKNEEVKRDNLPGFVAAANMAYKVVRAFRAGTADFVAQPDLPADQKTLIEAVLMGCQSHDPDVRLANIRVKLSDGAVAPLPEPIPPYVAKGEGSWKHKATGLDTVGDGGIPPQWTQTFETSDYRKFHDAVKEHRMDVTQYLLPEFGLRLA